MSIEFNAPFRFEHACFFQKSLYRNVNHDFYGVYTGKYGELYIISKGHGREGTEVISQMALNAVLNHFNKLDVTYITVTAIKHALQEASKVILSYTAERVWFKNYGASIAFVLINKDGVFFTNVGDSKIVLLRKGKLSYITKDNSVYKDLSLVDNNETLAKKSKNHVFFETIGVTYERPEIITEIEVEKNDCFLIATKGVFQRVTRQEILRAFQMNDLKEGLATIWESAQNKKSYDDFTMIAMRLSKPGSKQVKTKTKNINNSQKKTVKNIQEKSNKNNKGTTFLILFIISLIVLAITSYPYLGTIFNLIWN